MNWPLLITAILLGLVIGLWIVMRRESKKAVISLTEEEFINQMRKGQLVDLRKKEDFDTGHINGAKHSLCPFNT